MRTPSPVAPAEAAGAVAEPREISIDALIEELGVGVFHVYLLGSVGLFMLASALQFAILSFLGPELACEMVEWQVTPQMTALLSTMVFFGMLLGTLTWGFMGDHYGRKPTMVMVASLSLFNSFIRIAAQSFSALLGLQFLLGLTLSGFGVAFTYFIEFFPAKKRALWSMFLTMFWTAGIILATLIAWGVARAHQGWRLLLTLSSLPLIFTTIAMLLLPRSPRYLVSKNRMSEANAVFVYAAKTNAKKLAPFTLTRPGGVSQDASLLAVLSPRYRRTTLLLWFIWLVLGFIYFGGMMMTTNIDAARGAQSDNAGQANASATWSCPPAGTPVFTDADYLDSLIGSLSEIPGIGLTILLVDRMGRRFTQSIALGGFGLGLFLVAISNGGRAMDIILLFVARALANTAYSVTWIYTPEVFPTSLRTTAFALAECCAHIGSMITPFVAQTMLDLGYLNEAAGIMCLMAWLGVVATNLLTVETAGAGMASEELVDDKGGVEMTVV